MNISDLSVIIALLVVGGVGFISGWLYGVLSQKKAVETMRVKLKASDRVVDA